MDLQKTFGSRAQGYTPATMWFTAGNISKQEMTYQLEGFAEKGIQDFFIHPCDGTQGDYLGDHFFRMIRHAAAEAKRLGIHYWIYDEYNWPSGVAAGQVLVEEPWTHSSCLSRIVKTAAAGETLCIELPPQATHNTKLLLCVADGKPLELTAENDTVYWTNTSAEEMTLEVYFTRWMIRKIECLMGSDVAEKDAYGYLDMLDKEAVGVFIRKTHEAYKAQIGEGFGKHVKGVFTDEVMIKPQAFGEMSPEYPWTRFFEEKFLERTGYDIRPRVKELMDHSDAKLLVDYWETVSDLFMGSYMDLTHDWCVKNGLIYTGHMLLEESLESTVIRGGDPYEYYKRFDWPGIDTIMTYYNIDDYNYNITAKRASSAAHFLHKERLLSETFTMSGWDIRLRDMKRIFNRLALLGVNFIQYMGSAYDFSPGAGCYAMTNNWQNPLFEHYDALSDYISGVQKFVAETTCVAKTLLLYPMTTARVTLPQLPIDDFLGGEQNLILCGLVNALLNLNVPFEFAFEQLIDGADVADGRLLIEDEAYDTVILPFTTYLKETTFRKLQAFAAGGGRVVEVNGVPEKIIGERVYDAPKLEGAIAYDCREYECVPAGHALHRAPMGTFTRRLKEALGDNAACAVRLEPCDGLMSVVRKKGDAVYVMLINDFDRPLTASGQLLQAGALRAVDTETGRLLPVEADENGFRLQLEACQCVVLELTDSADGNAVAMACAENRIEIVPQNVIFRPLDSNIAMPDMWQVRGAAAEAILQARKRFNPRMICELAAALTEDDRVLCRGNGGIYDISHKRDDWFGWQPVDGKPIKPGESVVCVYEFTVETVPEQLELISDPQWNTVWYLNNEQLYQTSTRRVWHYANPVFDLSGIAEPGKNTLVAICTYPESDMPYVLPCAVLKGDFRFFADHVLTQRPGGNAPEPWNEQGYLCYAGKGTYTMEFTAPECRQVILELETSDAAEIFLNGRFMEKRLWTPYRADLTAGLIPGKNTLEIRITSTLSNFLYGYNPSGIKAATLYAIG